MSPHQQHHNHSPVITGPNGSIIYEKVLEMILRACIMNGRVVYVTPDMGKADLAYGFGCQCIEGISASELIDSHLPHIQIIVDAVSNVPIQSAPHGIDIFLRVVVDTSSRPEQAAVLHRIVTTCFVKFIECNHDHQQIS